METDYSIITIENFAAFYAHLPDGFSVQFLRVRGLVEVKVTSEHLVRPFTAENLPSNMLYSTKQKVSKG